jgi:hypothetical protein
MGGAEGGKGGDEGVLRMELIHASNSATRV